jgi:ketosteroid isomerase-like protein
MSAEDVELAQAAYEALSRHDLEGFLELLHPDVAFTSLVLEADGHTYRGHDGAREWWSALHDTLGHDARFSLEGIEDHGDEWVLVEARFAATVRGAALEQRFWQAVRAADGKAVWWGAFRTRGEALEAVRSLAS